MVPRGPDASEQKDLQWRNLPANRTSGTGAARPGSPDLHSVSDQPHNHGIPDGTLPSHAVIKRFAEVLDDEFVVTEVMAEETSEILVRNDAV